jgi:hypothetical protein
MIKLPEASLPVKLNFTTTKNGSRERLLFSCHVCVVSGLSKKSHENQKLRILQTQNAAKAA